MMIAMHVRNQMEDFHCEHLMDKQMAELNPIIRQAVFEGILVVLCHQGLFDDEAVSKFLGFLQMMIPDCWEVLSENANPEFFEGLCKEQESAFG